MDYRMLERFSEEDLILLYASLIALQEVGQDSSAGLAKQLGASVVKGVLIQKFVGISKKGIVKGRLVSVLQKLGMKGLGNVIPAATLVADVTSMLTDASKDWIDTEDVVRVLTDAHMPLSSSVLDQILLDAGWKKTRLCIRVMEVRDAAWRGVRGRQAASAASDLAKKIFTTPIGEAASAAADLGKKAINTSPNDLYRMSKNWWNSKEESKSQDLCAERSESDRKQILVSWLRDLEIRSGVGLGHDASGAHASHDEQMNAHLRSKL